MALGPRAAALRLSRSVVDGAGLLLDLGVVGVSNAAVSARSGLESLGSGLSGGAAGVAEAAAAGAGAAVAGLSGVTNTLFGRTGLGESRPASPRTSIG